MNPVLQGILIGLVVGTVLALLGYFLGGLRQSKNQKSDEVIRKEALAIEAVKERDKRIGDLEKAVENLEAKSDAQTKAAIPIEAAMQAMLIAKLTNAHTPEADALLKKQTDGTLTVDDAAAFAKAMLHRTTDMDERIGEGQRIAADILAGVTRLKELAEEAAQGAVKTMMVTVPETETVAARDGGTQEQEKGN